MLIAGTPAPELSGIDQNGNTLRVQDFAGSKLALYFYPKDDTSVCTKEACNLRDNYESLLAKGIKILGVSTDSTKSHQAFIEKYALPFPLIADTEKVWVNAYGVWVEKSMYGNKYMGIARTTFLIDEQGVISHVIEKVESSNHAKQILKLVGA